MTGFYTLDLDYDFEQLRHEADHCLFKKQKAEHLYSALHGIQTTLKRSGMDHTAFNLQKNTMPAFTS